MRIIKRTCSLGFVGFWYQVCNQLQLCRYFYNNCFKNGILPIKIDNKIVLELAEYSKRKEEIEINLEKQEISYGNKVVKFEVDAFKKKCLIEGLDDIALSMEKISQIDNFEKKLIKDKPWLLKND